LLDTQKEERGELIDRQELGLRSPHLLDRVYRQSEDAAVAADDRDISQEEALDRFGIRRGRSATDMEEPLSAQAGRATEPMPQHGSNAEEPLLESPLGHSERPPSRDLGLGLAGGVLGALGALGDGLIGGHSKPVRKPPPQADALVRFGVQRGQPPPGDAVERAAREQRQAHDDWRVWREYQHLAEGQDR
jgi:hypothetical protein